MTGWREMSPAELLTTHVVLSAEQVAYVLGLSVLKGPRRGQPDSRQVLVLVERRRLRPIDAEQPVARWTFSSGLVRRYIDDPGMVIVPSRAAV